MVELQQEYLQNYLDEAHLLLGCVPKDIPDAFDWEYNDRSERARRRREGATTQRARRAPRRVRLQMTLDQFITWDALQDRQHEFKGGIIAEVPRASRAQATVAANLAALIRPVLRGTPCRLYVAQMLVVAPDANAAGYPTALITCDSGDAEAQENHTRLPVLIFEVLSRSETAAPSMRTSINEYRSIKTLCEFVRISCDRRRVDVFQFGSDRSVTAIETYGEDQNVKLTSISVVLKVSAFFEDVPMTLT